MLNTSIIDTYTYLEYFQKILLKKIITKQFYLFIPGMFPQNLLALVAGDISTASNFIPLRRKNINTYQLINLQKTFIFCLRHLLLTKV